MTKIRDSPMAEQLTEVDLFFGKARAREARQKAFLASLLKPAESKPQPEITEQPADEEDFNDLGDLQGVGAPKQEEDVVASILRRKPTSNDKLLETLLGKKAAEAKKKSEAQATAASKSNIALKNVLPKSASAAGPAKAAFARSRAAPQDDSDDGEDMGRAAAFSSKKQKKTRDAKRPAYTGNGAEAAEVIDPDADPPDPREETATLVEMINGQEQQGERDEAEEEDERPRKKKPRSYLDELLNRKKKKKGKGKP